MTITADVKSQLFTPSANALCGRRELIRLPSEAPPSPSSSSDGDSASSLPTNGRAWTADEHNRFLAGLELYPSGPWKEIAAHVGTRTTRQTMTHAQKYREKIARRKRGLRSSVKAPRSFKRRRDQHKRHDAASPCSVAGSPPILHPPVSVRRGVDPMDFHGCFVPGHSPVYGLPPVTPTEIAHFAARGRDLEPLVLSEEEIDYILDIVHAPVVHAEAVL